MSMEQWREKWKQIRPLGEGGQGTTYEVQSVSDPTVRGVLKLLNDDSDEQARSRMAIEAINLVKLNKKAVKVPMWMEDNTGQYKDLSIQLYLVMQFIEGQTLDKVVQAHRGRLQLDVAFAIAQDLCATIGAMHLENVLHRDLKPANLMVRNLEKADLVVLDLGLSYDRLTKEESVTRPGESIKNELFAQPLLSAEDRRDARIDITNIVGTFFYCLTGKLPRHVRDQRDQPPHYRDGLTMKEVLHGDSRIEQVDLLRV